MKDLFKSLTSKIGHFFDDESVKPMEGIFHLQKFKDDELTYEHNDKNLIVNDGFLILAQLLSTADATKRITKLALGKEGISNNRFVYPFKSDKTLRAETYRHSGCEYFIDPVKKEIEFKFTISKEQGNGPGARLYNEAGLMAEDGTLMSRKVFPECVKTPEELMIIRWILVWK